MPHSGDVDTRNDAADADDDVVIVSALRSPLCKARQGGGLVNVPPAVLLQHVLAGILQQTNGKLSGNDVEDVCVGTVLLPAVGYASLRMAHIAAGIPAETCSFQTVNRQCASSLQAASTIVNAIRAKEITIGIAAGVESMSSTPMHRMTTPLSVGDWKQMPASALDCLIPMGITSDTVVKEYGLERHVLDQFAVESHVKAAAAQQAGKFVSEIVPVTLPDGTVVTQDDGIRPETTFSILSKLKPAFTPNGSTTAGTSSQTTDGAAAVLFMTRREAVRRKLPIRAIWRGYCTAAVPPRIMGIGPTVAIPKLLAQQQHQSRPLSVDDIDVFEINEAFASQAVYCIDTLGLNKNSNNNNKNKNHHHAPVVNPNGGAIALGHPLGCTGARLIASIIPELHRRKARYGVVSMCIGTGMGAAALLEVEPQSSL